ncbi:ATP-binding protein [Streptomyces sp. NPDC059506]|uniref:ATP-binding protein n=1 Tax=Streptomyces TaxID=1883 RepID=UPI0026A38B73|nr:ATP-binding protein [Streptomyces sp. HB2AG]
MALVVAQQAPASSAMALSHGPEGVGEARRRLRKELFGWGAPDPVVDDAVLILSELLSNSYRHARALPQEECGGLDGCVRAAWRMDEGGLLTLEVTDGGGPTRPMPSSRPSLTARGGRGLGIVGQLALDWGVRDGDGTVTVWVVLAVRGRHARREGFPARSAGGFPMPPIDLGFEDPFEELA